VLGDLQKELKLACRLDNLALKFKINAHVAYFRSLESERVREAVHVARNNPAR